MKNNSKEEGRKVEAEVESGRLMAGNEQKRDRGIEHLKSLRRPNSWLQGYGQDGRES